MPEPYISGTITAKGMSGWSHCRCDIRHGMGAARAVIFIKAADLRQAAFPVPYLYILACTSTSPLGNSLTTAGLNDIHSMA